MPITPTSDNAPGGPWARLYAPPGLLLQWEDTPKAEVVKNIMLKDAVDGEFTTVEEVAETSLFFAAFERADRPVARREPRRVHALTPCAFGAS